MRRRTGITPAQRKLGLLLLIVISLVGIVMTTVGFFDGKRQQRECTATTTGVISKTRTHSESTDTSYISYTVGGKKYEFSRVKKISEWQGDRVKIHYNPDNPADAYAGDTPEGIRLFVMRLVSALFIGLLSLISFFKTIIRG